MKSFLAMCVHLNVARILLQVGMYRKIEKEDLRRKAGHFLHSIYQADGLEVDQVRYGIG